MDLFIVDDAPRLVKSLTSRLTEIPGVRVCGTAGGFTEALSQIRRLQPDIVVLDYRLPDGNGLDVLSGIKQLPDPPDVIFFSDYAKLYHERICLEHGAEMVLGKTDDQELLLHAIEKKADARKH